MLPVAPVPTRSQPAYHTVLILDCSSSIRSNGLLHHVIQAANEVLGLLRPHDVLVSVVYFNADIRKHLWRVPAKDAPTFTEYNYPVDNGTRLYDAITTTVEHLRREFLESHGESNSDTRILIFTDGMDSQSRTQRMDARLALGEARKRNWGLSFVTAVPGLAADLGMDRHETMVVSPGGDQDRLRAGFRSVTVALSPEEIERMRLESRVRRPPLPDPPPAPPKRPWWRWWR